MILSSCFLSISGGLHSFAGNKSGFYDLPENVVRFPAAGMVAIDNVQKTFYNGG
jgi:hypothetical protein